MRIIVNYLRKMEYFDKAFFHLINSGKFKTRIGAFNHLNDLYVEAYGKERYSDWNSWRVSRTNRLKRNAKRKS